MHYAISYQLASARIDRLRRTGRKSRFAEQLWALLHVQVLLDGSATYTHQR